jgi:simple sugar transport system ATP-binding protein
MSEMILEMKNILKIYPNGIVANEHVNFSVKKGEIHALLGENGAGKSTLMKVLFGIERQEEGEIYHKGEKIEINSPHEAIARNIGMVHQHFMLVPSLTVAENIILGVEPKKNKIFTDMDEAIRISKDIAQKYNFDIDVTAKIEDIPVGTKQQVEILKALYRGADILILDEPTAVLTPQETKELFEQLRKLKDKGHTIIFISHKLDEIKAICDRLTIMRNGKSKGTYETKDTSTEEMSRLMVGRDVFLTFDKEKAQPKDTVLKVRDLCHINSVGTKKLNNVSFDLKTGEILGIAGVEGNGQSELFSILTGLIESYSGSVKILDKEAKEMKIKDIRDLGVSYIPEDRMIYGCAEDMDILHNLISDKFDKEELSTKYMLKKKDIEKYASKMIEDYNIKAGSYKQNVSMLSGGNIQKVVVAREFSAKPTIILANQPTRGIDVGAAEFIRKKLIELSREENCAVLLISADLNEVFELSDRLAVMYKGEFSGSFTDVKNVTEEELGKYMLGVEKDEELEGITYE